MTQVAALKTSGWEDQGVRVMYRAEDNQKALLQVANLTTIHASAYKKDTDSTETMPATSLTIADVVEDTLQTNADDARWTEDDTGYNFNYFVPGSAFPDAGDYQVVLKFTPTVGEPWFDIIEHTAYEVRGQ